MSIFKKNMIEDNPILIQILGICSTLAVTNLMINTLIMTLGVLFVISLSCFVVSLLKSLIPRKIRMITQVIIIAFFTIIVDILLQAYQPEVSKSLGPYVGLIITNCIIMGRAEAFAQSNSPFLSFWDGFTSGLGYMAVLVVIAFFRELLGFGSLFGVMVLPESFNYSASNWGIMVMAPSAFFFVGIILWVVKSTLIKEAE